MTTLFHPKRSTIRSRIFLLAALLTPPGVDAVAQSGGVDAPRPSYGLLLSRTSQNSNSRRFFFSLEHDPVHAMLRDGTLGRFAPEEGAALPGDEGWVWKRVALDEKGLTSERGLYLYVPVESERRRAVLLHSAASEIYVNGEPRGGNVYGYNWVSLPIRLNPGTNHLMLRMGRKPLGVTLTTPASPVSLNPQDMTLPDLVAGESFEAWGAAVVINATERPTGELTLRVSGPGFERVATSVPLIGPMTVRKVGFRLRGRAQTEVTPKDGLMATLRLSDSSGGVTHEVPAPFRVVDPADNRRVTFVSRIDGSVQFYGFRPAIDGDRGPLPAIILTCHGASVDARRQSGAHSPKRFFHVVAPTNRRPYGYDWEDIGRMDAMEVLDLAQSRLRHDPLRTYVSGHSMGGHGAWHLSTTYPDRFAAVGPSAGWVSRSSYGRRRGRAEEEVSPVRALLDRSKNTHNTLEMVGNLKHHGVYIVHGAEDDNMPPSEARRMAEVLGDFHHDWDYHEEPGKRHWWSNDLGDEGSACVEYPYMMDAFARHAQPPAYAVRSVEFSTAHPGVNGRCHWVTIEQQLRDMAISRVNIQAWPNKRKYEGTTENVRLLRFDVSNLLGDSPVAFVLDGQTIDAAEPDIDNAIYLEKADGVWRVVGRPSPDVKGAHRYGGIRDVLGNRFVLVYGTGGGADENAWAYQKARYDAETFWYRGNGSVDVMTDADFLAGDFADRTVALYGNADTNRAWGRLLGDSPVGVKRGEVRVGERVLEGADLSAMFVRPRPDSDVASVIAIGGSGVVGMNDVYRTSLFGPASRFPDLQVGRAGETIAAGYFGPDWSVKRGEFAFE
ncbi:MAG: alpha/beta hydrolase-fold protein [Planctomycetota bacterium]|jgi:predicted esterase